MATEGLAINAADLAIGVRAPSLVIIATVAWILGMVVYLAVTGLIGWRVLANTLRPAR